MEITLYKSPKKAFKLILISSIVAVCAMFVLVTIDAPTTAWYVIIGVYGLVYPVALFHLFDRRPQIVINEIGIFDRRTCKDFINWKVIKRAWAQDAMVVSDVFLLVDDKYLSSLKKAAVNRPRMIYPEIRAHLVVISVGQLAVDPFKLTEFILKMIKASQEGRKDEFKGQSGVELRTSK
ncbi:MAG TPA: hypothetical protein VK589_21965 [Chryseolinea sp.]|nr:hypothetical protein [Chryseolinea sp.]